MTSMILNCLASVMMTLLLSTSNKIFRLLLADHGRDKKNGRSMPINPKKTNK